MKNTIEEEIDAYDERVYGGTMTAAQRAVLRAQLEREERFWERESRDYLPADAGNHV